MLSKIDLLGLAFIRKTFRRTGEGPSMEEIRLELGFGSKQTAWLLVRRLAENGLINYGNGRITLLGNHAVEGEVTVSVPLLGSIAAGLPSLAEERHEGVVRISTKLAKPGKRYFLLRADGDSMNRAGIKDGDLMLIRQEANARQGEIVVALIDDEATVKFFEKEGVHYVLRPKSSNRKHKPIIVHADLRIQGVFVTVIPDVL
jgi:repressor LexA